MTDSIKIKEKVKDRYGKVALSGDSCCGPSISIESGGGCCSGNNNAVLQSSQSAAQVAELVGYDLNDLNSIPTTSMLGADVELPQSLLL
jgi:arsenite methyltransferase